jgi:hypothetical protein
MILDMRTKEARSEKMQRGRVNGISERLSTRVRQENRAELRLLVSGEIESMLDDIRAKIQRRREQRSSGLSDALIAAA